METPCKECDRKGCGAYHDICPAYQQWAKEENEEKELIRKAKQIRAFVKDTTFNSRTHGQFRSHKK